MMVRVYEDQVLSMKCVYEWKSREIISDSPRSGRLATSVSDENFEKFPRAPHHSKWRHRWVGVKGSSRNGRHFPTCPSARHFRMVREDTGSPTEDTICAWMAADEAVGCTRAFITMRCSSG
ncbi:uncharacterized protein TNCV_2598321 [Trichonephila clavipes]|nr:uncharacterized protein TNCV_2598321 [Trichonephila clavipes]